jgi:hypothetical protein
MAACELAFGVWNIYYKRKHPDQALPLPKEEGEPESETLEPDEMASRSSST